MEDDEVASGLLEGCVEFPKFMSPKISNRRAESFSAGGPLGLPIREMPPPKLKKKILIFLIIHIIELGQKIMRGLISQRVRKFKKVQAKTPREIK